MDNLRYETTYDSYDRWLDEVLTTDEAKYYGNRGKASRWVSCSSYEELVTLAREGWQDGGRDALAIADEVIRRVESTNALVPTFQSYTTVSGGSVDVGLYLADVPECMIDYEPVIVSNAGRVIRLVISVGALAAYSADDLIKRGAATVALALVLESMQLSCEIWLDSTISPSGSYRVGLARTRILIKHSDDVVSPERLAFILGHPASLRCLIFTERTRYPADIKSGFGIPGVMGQSQNPIEDMEEGTIYTPALNMNSGGEKILHPYEWVTDKLRDLGLMS